MTTCVYDRRCKTIEADSQNTDRTGAQYRTNKIERLKDGRYFLGSGNCYTIGITRRWAEQGFAEAKRPDYSTMIEDPDEYSFTCLVISADGNTVTLIDDEMEPMEISDDYIAIGSGAAYAIGALDAGASINAAVLIACERDGSTSLPIHSVTIP